MLQVQPAAMASTSWAAHVARIVPPELNDERDTRLQWITARSHHPGGVNASRCDGSAEFVTESIEFVVWQALTSAAGGDVISR